MLFLEDDAVPDIQGYIGWRAGTGALIAPECSVVIAFSCVLILWVLAAFLMGCLTTNSGAWGLRRYFLGWQVLLISAVLAACCMSA